jgi:hypothetical protein
MKININTYTSIFAYESLKVDYLEIELSVIINAYEAD